MITAPDTACDFALLPLPNCMRTMKLDWIFSGNHSKDQSEHYIWCLYETFDHTSSISILKTVTQDKHVLIRYEICYTIIFDDFITDIDCTGSTNRESNILCMLAAATSTKGEKNEIRFYNLPLNVEISSTETNVVIRLTKPMKMISAPSKTTKIERISWNQNVPSLLAMTDSDYNIYIINVEKDQTLLNYFHAHTMEITRVMWINGSSDYSEFEQQQESSSESSSVLVTCSHDGNIKIWDPEDPFAPCFVHSTGQRWVYNIEWDPLLKVLHYNSEGKNNSYSYLAFYGIQPPILKKYIIASQATLVIHLV